MTNNFIKQLKKEANYTTTENQAKTHVTTGNKLVDFFALGGATRHNLELGLDLFKKAYAKDQKKAVRILFYFRDVRGGQGERDIFRVCLYWLAKKDPDTAKQLLGLVPEYGRWDDLFHLVYVDNVKHDVFDIVRKQLKEDRESDEPSLLAKWMPSENASSDETKKRGRIFRNALGMTERTYRKTLSALREEIGIIETKITEGRYDDIDYEDVPSQALFKYQDAFMRHDEANYRNYLNKVQSGDKEMNTSTLYTYQIYKAMQNGKDVDALNTMWDELPDYTDGENALVMADVSGSMVGDPMSVSVSLALYFADKNEGVFSDTFMTFSAHPQLQEVGGDNLRDKMTLIERADWDQNTDLYRAMKTIVDTAVDADADPEELPDTLYIISDMEFDVAIAGGGGRYSSRGDLSEQATNFEAMQELYDETDYDMPNIVFWNVDARNKQVPVMNDERGVTLVSGFSPSTFEMAVEEKTPKELMEETIADDRYSRILG